MSTNKGWYTALDQKHNISYLHINILKKKQLSVLFCFLTHILIQMYPYLAIMFKISNISHHFATLYF